MQNNNDNEELSDAGASADLPDESSLSEFLEKIQASLARQGWELRGTCVIQGISDALEDFANEILFVRFPGRQDTFYYFNRLEGWEATGAFRGDAHRSNFLALSRNELARDDWEYQRAYDEVFFAEALHEPVKQILAVRDPDKKTKFYVFHQVDEL